MAWQHYPPAEPAAGECPVVFIPRLAEDARDIEVLAASWDEFVAQIVR